MRKPEREFRKITIPVIPNRPAFLEIEVDGSIKEIHTSTVLQYVELRTKNLAIIESRNTIWYGPLEG